MSKNTLKDKEVDLKDLKDGDYVLALVHGSVMTGQVIVVAGDRWYICQDVIMGGKPEPTSLSSEQRTIYDKYKYSWCFFIKEDGCTDGVSIDAITKTEKELIKWRDSHGLNVITAGKELRLLLGATSANDYVTLFQFEWHPDCCGAMMLYRFCESGEESYTKYRYVTDENIKRIKQILSKFRRHIIVHLASYQECAKEFVARLGMTALSDFENPNSGNIVTIYELKPEDCENTE
jgi:hypothetical protein